MGAQRLQSQAKGYFERSSFETVLLFGVDGKGGRGGEGNWAKADIVRRTATSSFVTAKSKSTKLYARSKMNELAI